MEYDSRDSWLNLGNALRSSNPELAIKSYQRAGAIRELGALKNFYRNKAEVIANNGCDNKELEKIMNIVEKAESALEALNAS